MTNEDEEYENGIIPRLIQAGYRGMHRYWVMLPEPMTLTEIDHFYSTGFCVLNGEPRHLEFSPLKGENQ
jgi:hypothetical protein